MDNQPKSPGTFDDARATWDLLNEAERKALAALAKPQTITPQELGRLTGTTWQQAVRTARQLKKFGLVTVRSLPKQTSYELSGQGEACLERGRLAAQAALEGS
jgi:DNA-binding MarR family transcriptional regulator